LDLDTNQFTGEVPDEWWRHREDEDAIWKLIYLSIGSNPLSEWRIPTDISMASLQYLRMLDSGLSGSIPAEISVLTALSEFFNVFKGVTFCNN